MERMITERTKGAVYVIGTRRKRKVVGAYKNIPGALILDKPVMGFKAWHASALRRVIC